MFSALKQFFEQKLVLACDDSDAQCEKKIELATAALMFELMKTDTQIDPRERQALAEILDETFSLDDVALKELLQLAETAAQDATSLYEFTSLVNEHFDYEQRVKLMENLWRIAFADRKLDRYEEHMIRKVGDLVYLRHSDFIRTKLQVRESLGLDPESDL